MFLVACMLYVFCKMYFVCVLWNACWVWYHKTAFQNLQRYLKTQIITLCKAILAAKTSPSIIISNTKKSSNLHGTPQSRPDVCFSLHHLEEVVVDGVHHPAAVVVGDAWVNSWEDCGRVGRLRVGGWSDG